MSSDNKKNFIDESNAYILNMNKVLKNIKSNISVDFICTDIARIIVITNKVVSFLDLQTIKQYVKDTNHINFNKVDFSRLL